METKKRIRFDFSPTTPERGGLYAVEKDEGGSKRRYIQGIASGIAVDGHGERMTQQCIESFQEQANSGNILLYEGLHGVNFVDDVGKLDNSQVTPSGDWMVQFRLYDEADGIGPVKLERADDTWKQAMGLPPYDVPRQFGFSIEGDIPEGGIQSVDSSGRRVINDVELDGVVLVKRPAYRASIAHGVYKALGELAPWRVRKNLESVLQSTMNARNSREEYWSKCYALQEALDTEIKRIMSGAESDSQKGELDDLLTEYSGLYSGLILEYPELFKPQTASDASAPVESVGKTEIQKAMLLRKVEANLMTLKQLMLSQVNKTGAKHGEQSRVQPGS